jgi:import inner membrane translocase subunit TIM17
MVRGRPVYGTYAHPVYGVVGFVGEMFLWGAAGGAAVGFARGLRSAPSCGVGSRLAGAVRTARANAPRVAGKFGAYCAAFSAVEAAVSRARGDINDMWCSVSASAAVWGHYGVRRGGVAAAAGGSLLGAAGMVVFYGVTYAGIEWENRRADAESRHRQKQMMDRGQPTPVAMAARRTAIPAAERPAVEILFAKYE